MKLAILFVGVNACNPLLTWDPGSGIAATDTGDTGGTSCDTNDIDDCANLDMEDTPFSFEGTIPGTEYLEVAPECAEECYRCFYLDSDTMVASVYFRVLGTEDWTVETFKYMVNAPGSYLMIPNTTWTSVRPNGLFSDQVGYLVIEPITGAVEVVGLSVCPELDALLSGNGN